MNFKKSNLTVTTIFGLASLYYTLPYFLNLHNWGVRDWDLFSTVSAVPIGTIRYYGQFPFWNPYLLGGNILFHHPEAAVFSPFFVINWLFGVVVGLKIQVMLCYFIGLGGSYRFGRSLGVSRPASVLLAFVYFGGVSFALHFAEGHIPFTHFCFLPWFIAFVVESIADRRRIVWAGLVLAVMILGNGAAVPLLYLTLFSFVFVILYSIEKKNFTYVFHLTIAGLTGAILAAVKFLPMVIYLIQNRWAGNPDEAIPLGALGKIFFGFNHSLVVKNFPEQVWGWHEYGNYISPILVLLAIAALFLSFKRTRIWLVLALFFFALGLGNFGSISPWALLYQLPGFSSARCTGRAFQFVTLSMAIMGALGFDAVQEKFSNFKKWGTKLLYIFAGLIVLTNFVLAWPVASEAFTRRPQYVIRSEVFEQVKEGSQIAYKNYLENRGSLIAPVLSAYHPTRALLDMTGRVMKDYVQSGSAEVLFRRYTPDRIEYSINASEPGKMLIGMGYDVGWSADDGRSLSSRDGLILIPFDAGRQDIVLTYRTPFFFTGFVISLLAILGTAFVYRRISSDVTRRD